MKRSRSQADRYSNLNGLLYSQNALVLWLIHNYVTGFAFQISNTVHKRVSYLVCTDEAFRRNTQRVRKAQKLNVTIVSPEFVDQAVKLGKLPDPKSFQVKVPEKVIFWNSLFPPLLPPF